MTNLRKTLQNNWRWLLVLSFIVLLPTKNVFNVPFGIMGLLGVIQLVRHFRTVWARIDVRWLFVLFACMWLPMLFALPDAVNFQHSAITTLKFLRFPLAGIFAVLTLSEEYNRRYLLWSITAVVMFWSLDGLVQFVLGFDLFGYELQQRRLTGIFYPKYRLGVALAVFLPIVFEVIRQYSRRYPYLWLSLITPMTVVLMSGSRAAWVMMTVSTLGYGVFLAGTYGKNFFGRGTILKIVTVMVICVVVAAQFPGVERRVDEALGVLSADLETIDLATKRRVSIWIPAIKLARIHWLNGIGPRSFRYAFLQSTDPDNFWMKRDPPGVTHPHLMVLEVAVECGLIGLLAYLLLLATVIVASWLHRKQPYVAATGLSVITALFPLNVHMALYGSFWSSVSWWLLYVWIACLTPHRSGAQGASSP